ncbi:hypothetical protein GCM10009715_36960 [Paeniglutamicibacter psychrophenolicus]
MEDSTGVVPVPVDPAHPENSIAAPASSATAMKEDLDRMAEPSRLVSEPVATGLSQVCGTGRDWATASSRPRRTWERSANSFCRRT